MMWSGMCSCSNSGGDQQMLQDCCLSTNFFSRANAKPEACCYLLASRYCRGLFSLLIVSFYGGWYILLLKYASIVQVGFFVKVRG